MHEQSYSLALAQRESGIGSITARYFYLDDRMKLRRLFTTPYADGGALLCRATSPLIVEVQLGSSHPFLPSVEKTLTVGI